MAFYKDIDRLRYLVETPGSRVRRGMFLAVVNELGYVTQRQQRKNLGYNTFHGTTVDAGALIPATEGRNGCPYPLQMPFHPICWKWDCELRGGRILPALGMRHYWLAPIPVLPGSQGLNTGRSQPANEASWSSSGRVQPPAAQPQDVRRH